MILTTKDLLSYDEHWGHLKVDGKIWACSLIIENLEVTIINNARDVSMEYHVEAISTWNHERNEYLSIINFGTNLE